MALRALRRGEIEDDRHPVISEARAHEPKDLGASAGSFGTRELRAIEASNDAVSRAKTAENVADDGSSMLKLMHERP